MCCRVEAQKEPKKKTSSLVEDQNWTETVPDDSARTEN